MTYNYNRKVLEGILRQHGIEYRWEGEKLMAFESAVNVLTGEDVSQWLDVGKWSVKKLYEWLGY